ncbi:MAG: DUF92 domain-containing protein [Anaerolineae bacterium]|nr:DUF92 domain-containing protein [Anaerolineae bacterium]
MDINWVQLLVGFTAALLVSIAARRAHSLSLSGAIAATLLGTVIFGLGGLAWALILLTFFITSTLLSRLFRKRKQVYNEKYSKGSERDAGQVLANGGIAGLFVILNILFPNAGLWWLAFAGSLAAANADTWATELGVLGHSEPILITSGKKVERGTSGGISAFGTLIGFGGALLVSLVAALCWTWATGLPDSLPLFLLRWLGVGVAGVLGSLTDSWLGATVQAIYTCPTCNKETERHPLHSCGTPTRLIRGLAWMDNDWVNTLCTLAGALAALIFGLVLK